MNEVTCQNPRCGADNPAGRRTCRRCRRVLVRMTPEQRSAAGRLAISERWARVRDGAQATAAARAKSPSSITYWLARVDPDGEMTHRDRARAAENARRAYYQRLGRMGTAARRATP